MFNVKRKMCAAALCVGTVAYAGPAALLPLAPGTYVLATYKPCEEAPLAGTKVFDGKTFIGAHESECTSSIVSRHGRTYQVSTECRALGDGTPEKRTHWLQTVQVESTSRLAVVAQGKAIAYELCPGFR